MLLLADIGRSPLAGGGVHSVLQEREVVLYEVPGGVKEVLPGQLLLADERRVPFDECLWSTQASAAGWLADTGLPVDAGVLAVPACACGAAKETVVADALRLNGVAPAANACTLLAGGSPSHSPLSVRPVTLCRWLPAGG